MINYGVVGTKLPVTFTRKHSDGTIETLHVQLIVEKDVVMCSRRLHDGVVLDEAFGDVGMLSPLEQEMIPYHVNEGGVLAYEDDSDDGDRGVRFGFRVEAVPAG